MTQLATFEQRRTAIRDAFEKRRAGLSQLLPDKGILENRFLQVVFQEITRNPTLIECTPASLFASVAECFRLGLEPGGILGHAFLVPYRNKQKDNAECQFQVGYRGLVVLAHRSNKVRTVSAGIVYDGDDFDYELGMSPRLRHRLGPEHPGGDEALQHAWCLVDLINGGQQLTVLTRKECDLTRKRSPAGRDGSGPWITDYAAMCLKTAVRRAMKLAPMSPQLTRAANLDELAEAGLPQPLEAELEAAEAQAAIPAEKEAQAAKEEGK